MSEIREAVRERYASKARSFAGESAEAASGCCGPDCCSPAASEEETVSCGQHYESSELIQLGMDSSISLGCGNPLLLAELKPGETVLDLGSGGGLDVLLPP